MQPWKKRLIRGLVSALDGVPFRAAAPPREYVVGRRLDARSDGIHILALNEIIYIFLGSQASTRLIKADWISRLPFDENSVYARTPKGVFRVFVDRIADLEALMSGFELWPLNRSLTARLDCIRLLDGSARVVVYVGTTPELLQVGQRDFDRLLKRYRVTRRVFR